MEILNQVRQKYAYHAVVAQARARGYNVVQQQAQGGALRLLQSGNIRSYAAWVLFGSVVVIVAMAVAGGVR